MEQVGKDLLMTTEQRVTAVRQELADANKRINDQQEKITSVSEIDVDGIGGGECFFLDSITAVDLSLDTLINIQCEILNDLNAFMKDYIVERDDIEKKLGDLEDILNCPEATIYNKALELKCPHCDHGTYIDVEQTLTGEERHECSNCGGYLRISEQELNYYNPINAIHRLETEINELMTTPSDCVGLRGALTQLKKIVL